MPNGFHWKNDYSVGIDEIDRQHAALINLVAKMELKQRKGILSHDEFHEHMNNFVQMALRHFDDEEKVIQIHNPIYFDAHKKQHSACICQVGSALVNAMEKDPDKSATISFFRSWLEDHIVRFDVPHIRVSHQ